MRLKVIRKWPIHRKTCLFCTLLFFPFKFLQQSPVCAGYPQPSRFDYFSFGIARARPNRSQDRKGFYLEKVLIGDNFEKKFELLTADLWKQCRTFLQCRLTQHRLAQGNLSKQIQAYSFSFLFFFFLFRNG